ncbi:hypothetical protein [Parvibaculum sp.]|uniref:hypothetical protein n=1 Tax=Parvibaculum sp. TaxID=2024848 RepID=UPI0025D3DC12|nr:hypothetical protein [Parvibaculum sp.]
MHFFINIGLPFSIHIGRIFVFETDFRSVLFVRVVGVGQAWVRRGMTCCEGWLKIRGAEVPVPFIG